MRKITLLIAALFTVTAFANNDVSTFTPVFVNLDNAGTPIQLRSATAKVWVQSVLIEALPDNTGDIYIANSSANASGSARHTLEPGDTLKIEGIERAGTKSLIDLSTLWFDGATSGDDIVYSYVQ